MATHTISETTADASNYANGSNTTPVQQDLDTALLAAEQDIINTGLAATVVVNIVPPGGTAGGQSRSLTWSRGNLSEYLRPPGDSTRFQPNINTAINQMVTAATSTGQICTVTFTLNPT